MSKVMKELIGVKDTDIPKLISEAEFELIKINAQVSTGTSPQNAGNIRLLKKKIARLHTISRQREIEKLISKPKKEVIKETKNEEQKV